jgi:hypothetical protein
MSDLESSEFDEDFHEKYPALCQFLGYFVVGYDLKETDDQTIELYVRVHDVEDQALLLVEAKELLEQKPFPYVNIRLGANRYLPTPEKTHDWFSYVIQEVKRRRSLTFN